MAQSLERTEIGSTLIVFDCDGCGTLADAPKALQEAVERIVKQWGFTPREQQLLDVWESQAQGSSTVFTPLQESHVHLYSEFVRLETWSERVHVNGEVQVCNYSRDNREAAVGLAESIIIELEPRKVQLFILERGPGIPMHIVQAPKILLEADIVRMSNRQRTLHL